MSMETPRNPNELFEGNNWTLPTDIDLVEPAAEAFLKKLGAEEVKCDPDLAANLKLGFHEALVNAIAHGNLGIKSNLNVADLAEAEQQKNPTDKKVYVAFVITPKIVKINIRDEGEGFAIAGGHRERGFTGSVGL